MNRKLCMFRQNHGNLLHQQLQQKQFKICHSPHHPTPPWPPNMAAEQDSKEKVNSSMSVKSAPSSLMLKEETEKLFPFWGLVLHSTIPQCTCSGGTSASLSSWASVWVRRGGAWDTKQQPHIRADNKKEKKPQKRWCWRTGTLEYCVCVCVCELCLNYHCLQQWKKLFVSHRKTLSRLLSAFFSLFNFFSFFLRWSLPLPCRLMEEERVCVFVVQVPQMISKVFFSSMINCQSDFCISSLNQFFRASMDARVIWNKNKEVVKITRNSLSFFALKALSPHLSLPAATTIFWQ